MEWCDKWRVQVNPDKCFFIHYIPINSKKDQIPVYKIQNHVLQRKSQAKDLGVTISEDLKFHKHISNICATTQREINRIKRTFVTRSPKFLRNLHKIYVRPHLEYCANVWNSTYQTDITKIEKTQNKFTKLLKHGDVMTPEERNRYLNITTHKERRDRGDLITTYKCIENENLFQRGTDRNRAHGRRIFHEKNIKKEFCRTDIRRHSFAVRVADSWNNLPSNVVNADTLTNFKIELGKNQETRVIKKRPENTEETTQTRLSRS